MENNDNRDYGQKDDRSSQNQNPNTASGNDVIGNENSFRTAEDASDANTPGYNSGTNPDRYDAVNDGGAENASTENFTETERYSAGNSDFDERKGTEQNSELIPDSDDLEDDDEFDDDDDNLDDDEFEDDDEDFEDDEEDDREEPRTPGL